MNKKMLMLAATLIAGAVPLAAHAQTAGEGPEAGRQRPAVGAPNLAQPQSPAAPGGGLTSGVPQSQGGTAPNRAVVPPNLPAGLVPAPGRDPAPQLSTGGGSQLQQPGQTTTR